MEKNNNMTFMEFANKVGVSLDCDITGSRWGTYEVWFENSDSWIDDCASFNVLHAGTKSGDAKCAELFKNFCKDEKIHQGNVTDIRIVYASDDMREFENV